MGSKEVIILGAGVAGLTAARELESQGNSVTILTPESDGKEPYRSVYTTFQGPTAHLIDNFSGETLAPLKYFRLVTDHSRVLMRADGYFMVDYSQALYDLRSQLLKTQIEQFPRNSGNVVISESGGGAKVDIGGNTRFADVVIDCSGEESVTMKDENPITEFIFGGVFKGSLKEKEMVIAFVGKIGGTCWINPSVHSGFVDVVVSAWGWKNDKSRFDSEGKTRLMILRDFLKEKGIVTFEKDDPEITFSGSIRSQVADRSTEKYLYRAGDCAGMAIPKTGDGFRWAMLGAQIVAKAIGSGLTPGQAQKRFYENRPYWKDKLLEGAAISRLEKQARGILGTSVEPLGEILRSHPELVQMAEDFFVRESLHPTMLLQILANPHFREVLINSIMSALTVAVRGIDKIAPYYPFPEMK